MDSTGSLVIPVQSFICVVLAMLQNEDNRRKKILRLLHSQSQKELISESTGSGSLLSSLPGMLIRKSRWSIYSGGSIISEGLDPRSVANGTALQSTSAIKWLCSSHATMLSGVQIFLLLFLCRE